MTVLRVLRKLAAHIQRVLDWMRLAVFLHEGSAHGTIQILSVSEGETVLEHMSS